MITFAWYLLKVIICSGILFGYYYMTLRNKAFHRWNRFYLLATIVISIVVPVMKINIFSFGEQKGTVVQMLQTISYGDEAVIEYSRKNNFQLTTENVTETAYSLISAAFLFIFFLSLIKIKGLKKKYPATKFDDISFINTDAKGTPFSFFKSIFWNNAIELNSKSGQQIFNHEIAHIKEKHSYDKVFMNIVLIFFWINPFFWLIRKELYMIHEFIADKDALEDSDINAFAKMILLTVYPGQNFALTNNFFYSPLKRRLHMLTKNKNPKVSYISRLLVLPLAALVFCAFALKVKESTSNLYDGKTITVVIDAGHGGSDNGAISPEGVKEKDITLSIAKKIAEMNSNPHIQIVLSRDNDQTISVKERAVFSKINHADVFISIHVNAAANKQLSGFSVLSTREATDQNVLLCSAIIDELKKSYKTEDKIGMRKGGILVIDSSACPAAIIECGFLTNSKDAAFITNNADQQKIAENILNGIENFASSLTDSENKIGFAVANTKDSIPREKIGSGIFVDTHDKIFLRADKIINISDPEKTKVDLMKAVIVINGKIEPNSILKTKTITTGTLTIHSGDEKDMIAKYGEKAKNGVFILDNAVIKNVKPIYPEGGNPSTATGKVFTKVEIEASFPGGLHAWSKYISRAIRDSIGKFTVADYGTCVLRFIVNTDGTVSDLIATTMEGTELAKVSMHAIKYGPKWIPASQNGYLVTAYRLQPVTLLNADQKVSSTHSGSGKINSNKDDGKILTKVENEASFPGGQSAWIKYISRAIQDSIDKFKKADYGTCLLRFVVNTDGKVSDVVATTMKGTELAKVSINAIKKGPVWIPATQNGHTVACYRLQPVTLSNPEKKVPSNTQGSGQSSDVNTSKEQKAFFTKLEQPVFSINLAPQCPPLVGVAVNSFPFS